MNKIEISFFEKDNNGNIKPNFIFHRPHNRIHSRCIEYPWCASHYNGGKNILDVGSAKADYHWIKWLENLDANVFLTDYDYIEYPISKNTKFVNSDIRKTPFEDNFFDVIFAVSVVEHIGLVNPQVNSDIKPMIDKYGDIATFKELIRILKPGGKLLITIPFGNEFRLIFNYEARCYSLNTLNRFELPNVKQEVLEIYEYRALNNKDILKSNSDFNYSLFSGEQICEINGTYGWDKIHINDECNSNFSWCLDSVALCSFTKYEKEIKNNKLYKNDENHINFNYNLDVLFAEKRYEEILIKYIKYDLLETLYYIYKSYILSNQSKCAIPYLIRYIEKILALLKHKKMSIYKIQLLQKSLSNAVENLIRIFIDLECNIDRVYVGKIGKLIKEYKIMHDVLIMDNKQLSKLIYLLFSNNKYHEILCFKDINFVSIMYYLGRVYKNLGQNHKAIEFLNKYIYYVEIEKCNPELFVCSVDFLTSAYFHLGEVFYCESQKSDSIRCFGKCMDLCNGNHKKAKEYLERII